MAKGRGEFTWNGCDSWLFDDLWDSRNAAMMPRQYAQRDELAEDAYNEAVKCTPRWAAQLEREWNAARRHGGTPPERLDIPYAARVIAQPMSFGAYKYLVSTRRRARANARHGQPGAVRAERKNEYNAALAMRTGLKRLPYAKDEEDVRDAANIALRRVKRKRGSVTRRGTKRTVTNERAMPRKARRVAHDAAADAAWDLR